MLEAKGTPIGPLDTMIAAHALALGATLVTNNVGKFERVPGLEWRVLPDGWTFTVELRERSLYGDRDPEKLRALVPLTPNAFVLSGSLGEWIFVTDERGLATRILDFRKFEPLVWTCVE